MPALRSLRSLPRFQLVEDPIRESFLVEITDCTFTGRNTHYPNCLISTGNTLVNPYDERVMSLQRDSFYNGDQWETPDVTMVTDIYETTPVYFFTYNVDNYFHFLYDTLPYLAGYFMLKQTIPDLTLLLNTSHPTKQRLPPFVGEMLRLLNVRWKFVDEFTVYSKVFISSSFTHGGKSNAPPSDLTYTVWRKLADAVSEPVAPTPKRFYISRRTWVHNQTDNLGTNYTTRRCCENEDQVVNLLASYGIEEVFMELLTTEQKIQYCKNAELIVGVVGGGMCNLLFSPPITKALCFNTPYFLDINQRFKYSMEHTDLLISECSTHSPYPGKIPLYSRVKVNKPGHSLNGCIGEVNRILTPTMVTVQLSSNDVAGFSQDFPMSEEIFEDTEVQPLDKGLNSPYTIDLTIVEQNLKQLLGVV
jgi:hypothetical protein